MFKVIGSISSNSEILSINIILFGFLLKVSTNSKMSFLKCFPSKIRNGKIKILSNFSDYFDKHSSSDGLFISIKQLKTLSLIRFSNFFFILIKF